MKEIKPEDVKAKIEGSGYTVRKILLRAKVTPSTFSKWLHGKSTITVAKYNDIIKAYNKLKEGKE